MSIENEIWKRVTVDFYCNYFAVSNTGKLKRISRISKTDGHLIPEKILCFKKTEWGTYKPVIDLNTGTFWKVEDVAGMVGTSKKYMMKMLRGERLNTTQYKYA